MEYFLIASGAGLLIGIGGACLIVILHDAFTHHEQAEPGPILLSDIRPSPTEVPPLSSADTGHGTGRA